MDRIITPEFSIPSEVFIHQGVIDFIADILGPAGKRSIIVSDFAGVELFYDIIRSINDNLAKAGMLCMVYDDLPLEPNTEDIDNAVSFIGQTNCSTIIGIGGIEVINAAKIIALLVNNYIFCHDLFENGKAPNAPLNLVTIPGYPLFGFEISPLCYVSSIPDNDKKTIFDRRIFPKSIIIDPSLFPAVGKETLIKHSLAATAIAIESVISKNTNDISDTFAMKAIDLAKTNIELIKENPNEYKALSFLASASVFTGMAFSAAFLSVSMAAGLALAKENKIKLADAINVLIPFIMEYNLAANTDKYNPIYRIIAGGKRGESTDEAAVIAIEALREIIKEAGCPQNLKQLNVKEQSINDAAKLAVKYPFVKNSPQPIDSGNMEAILVSAM